MICWHCYWGWPKQVADIYAASLAELGGDYSPLESGPAHIVWGDENWDCVAGCIADLDAGRYCEDYTAAELAIVRKSLVALLALPEEILCCEPEDYDGENPENYPPPVGIVMVKGH